MKPLPIANPTQRWAKTDVEYIDQADPDDPDRPLAPTARLSVFEDQTREILSQNDSPDLGFHFSVNPYRGCFHACAYCYARPGHEYLSFGAGTDFDRKLVVKPHAPELLRETFERRSWKGDLIMFSGVTDCYQPLEAQYELTRRCLQVCVEYKQPVSVITKSPLIERDIDVLVALSKVAKVHVTVSIPFWNVDNARAIEPYVATPKRRMRIIERLAKAGLGVAVNVAPVIPGLNDEEIGDVLTAAKEAGATHAGTVLLRLPGPVAVVFEERLRAALPLRAEKVLRRIREAHGGKLYVATWGVRGRGEGPYADAVRALFEAKSHKLGLSTRWTEASYVPPDPEPAEDAHEPSTFTRPDRSNEMKLF